jgi:hypothetical protein
MRQPAHGCNVRANTVDTFHPDYIELITAMLFSLPTGLAGEETGPQFCCNFAALLKFSKYNIIWPVMVLACGSLQTVVTFVPNG